MGGGETAERALEPLEQLAGFHAVLGPFRSFDLCRLVFPRDPVAPVVIDHQMPGDGEEPRAELAGGLIHATALVHTEERLLQQILGKMVVAGQADEEGKGWRSMAFIEPGERLRVARVNKRHEFIVRVSGWSHRG